MDFDQLKKSWNNAAEELDKVCKLDKEVSETCKITTMGLKDKLVSKYCFLWILCAVCTVISCFFINHRVILPVMAIVLIFYFLILAILNYKIFAAFRKLNYNDMSVKDMLVSVTNIYIQRGRYQIVGYCMMIPVLIALMWNFYAYDMNMFKGGVIGCIIGFACGFYMDYKIEKEIKELKESLKHELEENIDD